MKSSRTGFTNMMFYMLAAVILLSVFPTHVIEAASAEVTYQSLQQGERVEAAAGSHYTRPTQKTVYLTFDDGPSPHTVEVLELLKKEDIQATFFMLGIQAERRPELVRRVVKEGHTIGNHSYDHHYESLYGSFDEFWAQIEKTESLLQEIAGVSPRLIRAPGGTHRHFDAFYFYYLEQAGYEIHDWNIDSGDSKRVGVPKQEIIKTIQQGPFPHEITLLLHDGSGHEESVKALPEIIDFFREEGYQFAPLTPEVRPIQHSVGNPKWEKQYSVADFTRWTEAAQQKLASFHHGDLPVAQRTNEAADETERNFTLATKRSAQPPLQITYNHQALTLQEEEYRFRNQRFYVPLRVWQKQQGHEVSWNAANKTASIDYGDKHIHIDTLQHSVTSETAAGVTESSSMDLFIEQGTLYISLRDAMELDQYEVDDYILTMEKRQVFVKRV